jgi:hypothetical protein
MTTEQYLQRRGVNASKGGEESITEENVNIPG